MKASSTIICLYFLVAPTSWAWVNHPKTGSQVPVVRSSFNTKSSPTRLNGFLEDIFSKAQSFGKKNVVEAIEPPQYDPVTIEPDFRVAALFLGSGILLDTIPYIQLTLGPLVTLLGLLFLVQTFRIRFVLNEDNALELLTVNPFTGETKDSGENVVVGGANVWATSSIVNYDFFPPIDSSPVGPILVYFKETQTPSETWNQGPGAKANDPEKIAAGEAVAGQVHFFPAVCKSEQLRDEFVKRQVAKL
ncbi:hypothetical protein FisN_4Lh099 [Fistulifera solaris]|uniref:Uncharacterized protein n=1 Tax=Fistulifera solaris TaxID=1519565 RepID=A0A1Z5JZX7_FISSO|nr:hypothetical protein FisN_4Lh099 [Fistulifera solaris]|eukprot:GAX19321.1 hypothetical protein FisN_4Lh099 [Fistulifera solaris]